MSKKTFSIGPGVTCDLDRLVNTRLLVQANSGAGKSYTIRRILEQTHGKVQQLVIDPEGEFSSLRTHFDYVLAARNGGDTLADPRTAKLLAERLLELGVSAILDIYELKPHERISFVKVFLETIVEAPKTLWHPALIVLDEAHVFCPEKGHGEAESDDAVKSLATRGRKRGFCLIPATQRLSKLHKDVAAECNNKLIGRCSLDVDMKRAAYELGFTTQEQRLQLRDLKAGEFFAFGPALANDVTRVTVGAVQTEHPKAGSKLAGVVPPPSAKVKELLPKLSDLPAEAEAREKSVKDLQADVRRLTREVAEAKKAQPAPPPAPKAIDKPVLTDADRSLLEKVAAALADRAAAARDTISLADGRLDAAVQKAAAEYLNTVRKVGMDAALNVDETLGRVGLQKVLEKLKGLSHQSPVPPHAGRPADRTGGTIPSGSPRVSTAASPDKPRRQSVSAASGEAATLSGPELKILNSLAELELLGLYPADKQQLGLMAGYTNIRSGGFSEPLGRLIAGGWLISPRPGLVEITDAGRAIAVVTDAPASTDDLQARILSRLTGPEQKLLRALIAIHPQSQTKDELGAVCGYSNIRSGGFSEPLGRLSTLGLVVSPQRGVVAAASTLFLESSR